MYNVQHTIIISSLRLFCIKSCVLIIKTISVSDVLVNNMAPVSRLAKLYASPAL